MSSASPANSSVVQPYSVPEASPYKALFEDTIFQIVGYTKGRTPALVILQNVAQQLPNPADRVPFVEYGLGRLERLTLGDALRHTLRSFQYEIWRRNYFPTASAGTSSSASSSTGGKSSASSSDNGPLGAAASAPESSAPAGGKKRKSSAEPVAEDTESADGSILGTLAKALSPAVDAAVQPPKRASASSLSGLPAAIAKLVAASQSASSGGRGKAASTTAAVSAILAVVFALLQYIGCPPWLVTTALLMVAAGIGLVIWRSRRPAPAIPSGPLADDPGTTDGATPRTMSWMKVYLLCTGIGMIAILIAGTIWYLRAPPKPSKADVSAHLTESLAALSVRVAAIDLTYIRTGSAGCTFRYDAQIATTAPLYQRLNTADYLRTQASADMAMIDAASALQRADQGPGTRDEGPLAARIAAIGPAPTPALGDLVLVKIQTPPGKSAHISGTPEAFWNAGTWTFSNDEVRVDPKQIGGEAKPANALAVDLPTDAARLKALIAEHAAYAAKVQTAAAALAAELAQERQKAADRYAQLLQPGTVFVGTFVDSATNESSGVAFEITDRSFAAHTLTAVAHNDGGWTDGRPFQGDWSIGTDSCTVTLRTQYNDRIADAGPVLQDSGSRTIVLQLHTDGSVSGTSSGWQLHRVEPGDVAKVKAEFTRGIVDALLATQPGTVYRGTVTSKQRAAETVILRFTDRDAEGTVVRATFESPTLAAAVRPFRGMIVSNTYRAGSAPIRLKSDDKDRAVVADPRSLLGINTTNNTLALALRADGNRLVGGDERFTYEFEKDAGYTAARGSGIGRTDGTASSPGGSSIGGNSGTVAQAPNVGGPDATRSVDPNSVQPAGTADPSATSFPVLADASPCAYVLDGNWLPLSKNNPTLIQSAPQKLTNVLKNLGRWEDALVGKTTDPSKTPAGELTFDGRTYVTSVSGKSVVIAYVGPLTPIDDGVKARYPELKTYPAIELAPVETLANGKRHTPVFSIAPGFTGFGPNRVPATLEWVDLGVIRGSSHVPALLLRCTNPLAPGRYALNCGPNSYELSVE